VIFSLRLRVVYCRVLSFSTRQDKAVICPVPTEGLKKDERLGSYAPHGHWKTTILLAAPRHDSLTASLTVDGAINGEIFLGYVQRRVVLTLNKGDIVIMDNLSSHKRPIVRESIEESGVK